MVSVGKLVTGNRQERLQGDSAHKAVYLKVLRDWSTKSNSNVFIAAIATPARSKSVSHVWNFNARRVNHLGRINRHTYPFRLAEANSYWEALSTKEKQTYRVIGFIHRHYDYIDSSGSKSIALEGPQSSVVSILYEASELADSGNSRKAIRMIYKQFKDLIVDEKISTIDSAFDIVDYDSLATDVVIAMLTITIPVKDRLANRAEALRSAHRLIEERKEPEDDLLVGL